MFDERWPVPDGYEPTGRTPTEIRLIDPTECPAGHPVKDFRRGHAPCAEHRGHPTWTCACGQNIYRANGAFVGRLTCR